MTGRRTTTTTTTATTTTNGTAPAGRAAATRPAATAHRPATTGRTMATSRTMITGRTVAAALAAVGLCAALAGCGGGGSGHGKDRPDLSVTGAYLPQPPMADMAAGFLTVRNTGGAADRLTSVTTPLSHDVTLHTTRGTRMESVTSFAIPAHGELKLSSGGNHLMLSKLGHRPKVGERVALTLHFRTSAPIRVTAPVKPTTYRPKE